MEKIYIETATVGQAQLDKQSPCYGFTGALSIFCKAQDEAIPSWCSKASISGAEGESFGRNMGGGDCPGCSTVERGARLTPLPGTECVQSLAFGWKTGNSGLLCCLTTKKKKSKGTLLHQGCDQCHATLACGWTWGPQHTRDTHKSWEKLGRSWLEAVKLRGLIFPAAHRRWGTGKLEICHLNHFFPLPISSCSCRQWVWSLSRGEAGLGARVCACTAPRAFPAEVLELWGNARNKDDFNSWQQIG